MGFRVTFIEKVPAYSKPMIGDLKGYIAKNISVKTSGIFVDKEKRIWIAFIGNSGQLRYSIIKDKDGSSFIDQNSWLQFNQ